MNTWRLLFIISTVIVFNFNMYIRTKEHYDIAKILFHIYISAQIKKKLFQAFKFYSISVIRSVCVRVMLYLSF